MTITEVKTYRVTCDRDTGRPVSERSGRGPWLAREGIDHQVAIIHADSTLNLNAQLRRLGWRAGAVSGYVCSWCVGFDERAAAGPWCEDASHHTEETPVRIDNSKGFQVFCSVCEGKIEYKPPGVYC